MSAADFERIFGAPPRFTARAPGRVNLIGEHTDYNGGYVLPMALPQHTTVELTVRTDARVRAASAHKGGKVLEYALGRERKGQGWLDFLQGVTQVAREAGHRLQGFDVFIRSDVPLGSGLSSSAALEVSLLRALRQAFALTLDDVQLALLGQRAEVEFVGAPVGVMDQLASSLAGPTEALFIDTRTLKYQRVALPPGVEVAVVNSGVTHNHAGGDYKVRRAECERAAAALGVPLLSDLSVDDLPRAMALPDPLGRRVRHVLTENARVLATVEAFQNGDVGSLRPLFFASHASMRDDYQVSVPEIDLLVELAAARKDVLGARLTGGGFGGSVVILGAPGSARQVATEIAAEYARRSGRRPTVLVPSS